MNEWMNNLFGLLLSFLPVIMTKGGVDRVSYGILSRHARDHCKRLSTDYKLNGVAFCLLPTS